MYKNDITSRGFGSMSGYGKGERSKKRFLLDKAAPTPEELAEISLQDALLETQSYYENEGNALTEVMSAFSDVNSTSEAFGILEGIYNQHNRREKKDFDYDDAFVDDDYNNSYNYNYNDDFVTF